MANMAQIHTDSGHISQSKLRLKRGEKSRKSTRRIPMDERREDVAKGIADFSLPRWHEIPNVGLYLEQTAQLLAAFTEDLGKEWPL